MKVSEDVVTDAFEQTLPFSDFYYFYVPRRDIWQHWKDFCREDEVVDES